MTTERPCARCHRTGPLEHGASREVSLGTVAGALDAGWIVRCPDGHRAPPPVGAEVAAAIAALLPHGRRRRFGRPDRCTTCDAELTMPVRRTERPVTVEGVAGLPVTTIVLDLPSTRCSACSTDQVPSRSLDDVTATVLALFAVDAGGV